MPSRADVEQFATANRSIRALVLAELAKIWRGLNTLNANATRDLMLEAVPLLVASYGDVAATVAADFYDEVREASGVRGRFTAEPVANLDAEDLRGQVRWSLGPIYSRTPDPEQALSRLSGKVDEFTLQSGRDTVAVNTRRDPAGARWARVPVGKTCAFCTVLASRGAAYRSEETARGASRYHPGCDCSPAPFWPNDPYPEGYNPDALLQQYQDARKEADSGQLKPILSKLREQQGIN